MKRRINTPEALASYKARLGLTNADIADRLGLPPRARPGESKTVERMLKGVWKGNWENVAIILAAYNVKKSRK